MEGDSSRRSRTSLLALVSFIGGLLCLAGALWPSARSSPVRLDATTGVIALVLAAVLWRLGGRGGRIAAHAAEVLVASMLAVLALGSASAGEVLALTPVLITLGLFAAHAWDPRTARRHLGVLIALTTVGAVLSQADGWQVSWCTAVIVAVTLAEAQGRLSRQLRHAASTDPLTGLLNRRAWHDLTSRGLAREVRAGMPFTVALLDLDDFKAVNDALGHAAGDDLLRALARSWSAHLRETDLLGRHGGDEFVLGMPGADQLAAEVLLARLTASHPARWSVGTATSARGDSLDSLIARADDDLYRRKDDRATALAIGSATLDELPHPVGDDGPRPLAGAGRAPAEVGAEE